MISFIKKRLVSIALLLLPYSLHAQTAGNPTLDNLKKIGLLAFGSESPTDPKVIVANVVSIILGFVGIIFVILIIYSGIQWMTSGGNEDKITKAKDNIKAATIGLTLVFISYAIASSVTYWLEQSVSGSPAP